MTNLLNKKETLELILDTFQNLFDLLTLFITDVTTLKTTIDSLDLLDINISSTFATDYDNIITIFINNFNSILVTRKDIIKDDGTLVIKRINDETNDYKSEIWCTNSVKIDNITRFYPSRIICKYDNISILNINVPDTELIQQYDFHINIKVFSIFTSLLLGLDSELSNIGTLRDNIKENIDEVLLNASLIKDCCNKNMTIINYSIEDFVRIFLS
jgi:hypothetical protein